MGAARQKRERAAVTGGAWRRYVWVVGVAIYLAALWFVGWRNIRDVLLDARPGYLALFALIETANLWMRIGKWRLGLGPDRQAAGLFFLSKAAGNMSPGRVGELAPLALARYRNPRVAAWIVADRLMETSATIAFGILGLVMIGAAGRAAFMHHVFEDAGATRATAYLTLGMAVVVLLSVALPAYVLTRRSLFMRLSRRVRPGGLLSRAFLFLAEVSGEISRLPQRLLAPGAITCVATGLDISAGIFLLRAFGSYVPFAVMAFTQLVHGLAAALPVAPNATLLPYVPSFAVLHYVGGAPLAVLTVALGASLVLKSILFWTFFALTTPQLLRPRAGHSPAA